MVYLVPIFFVLSFILAWCWRKLPAYCQSSWFLLSTWGIFWVNFGYLVIHPESLPHVWNLALIFIASLPGMMLLDYWQKRERFEEEVRKRRRLGEVLRQAEEKREKELA